MGIGISNWTLARAVSRLGQLGVVSGTAIDSVFVRRLQDHGVDSALQRVLDRFPLQSVVKDVLAKYAPARHRDPSAPYRPVPMLTHRNVQASQDLLVLAAYSEVAQAKEGHDGLVGINLLTKVEIPTVATLYGAMLAGVDYVMMGAGIPSHIPGILDRLADGEPVELPLSVDGLGEGEHAPTLRFDPRRLLAKFTVHRPKFLGIVSSHVLATALARRSNGVVDGFVIESPTAGGHNAPPRGRLQLDNEGNPVYGERDVVDYDAMRALGLPFWIAGGVTTPEKVREARDLGAVGVQVGTLFAYCRESGMEPGLRQRIIETLDEGPVSIATSILASPTGYPFKVAEIEGTLSEHECYVERERVCDLGYLREAYVTDRHTIGYRCPAEPVNQYVAKGGRLEDTIGRVCLCNSLMAATGLGQVHHGEHELPIVTSGDCINEVAHLRHELGDYSAADVIDYLAASLEASQSLSAHSS